MITKKIQHTTGVAYPHPNLIFRKRIKTLRKIGSVITEIRDEMNAGTYPVQTHSDRLRRHSIHSYTWDKILSSYTHKVGKEKRLILDDETKKLIETAEAISVLYMSVEKKQRRILESIFFHNIFVGRNLQ